MWRGFLSALVCLSLTQAGVAQQPQPEVEPSAVQAKLQYPSPSQATIPASTTTAAEIADLKATVSQLQERLNQLAPGQNETESKSRWPLNSFWQDGLQIESQNKMFRVHVGGTLQVDSGWNAVPQAVETGPGGIGELEDGGVLRRARIRIDGTIYEHIEWVAEYDFANTVENDTSTSTQTVGSPSFINAWVGVNDIPLVGTVRAGWMKEPISFEFQKSGRWLTFMERTPGENSFFTRSVGIMAQNQSESERLTWAFGVFHVEDDNFGFGFGNGEYAEVGRITWLPWYEDEGERLLHVGFGARHGHLDQNQIDMKGRPSVRTMPGSQVPPLADTGTIDGTSQDTVDVELAAVCGSLTLQSEYYSTFIHDAFAPTQSLPQGAPLGTLFYQGAYLELLYFLTGEYQPYDLKAATFGRVVPLRNFNLWDGPGGWGAWQVGIRYGYLDLQNKGVNGATLHDIVLGLNWFLNPNTKVQWNLAIDHRESTPPGSSGWTYIFGTRLALDF
jgi:phosphate-selective porin OprO/OprP